MTKVHDRKGEKPDLSELVPGSNYKSNLAKGIGVYTLVGSLSLQGGAGTIPLILFADSTRQRVSSFLDSKWKWYSGGVRGL